jgi:ParB/RepB/Spo0J family partition protein
LSGSKPLPDRGDLNRSSVFQQVETSKIFVSGVNVRRSPGDVVDLMQSISEEGILEPLLVRPVDGRYELIVGSRRFEAAKRLGMKEVPAVVRTMGDEDALIISLVENIQRRDVEPEEEYDALMKLKKLNPALYSTTDQLAKAIGKSRQYVEDRVAAVEAVNTIRRGTKKSAIAVRQSPTMEERKEGVLPISHAGFPTRPRRRPRCRSFRRRSARRGSPPWLIRSPSSLRRRQGGWSSSS